MKRKLIEVSLVVIISMCFIPINVYSAFYDMEYPPNSSGKADYTEEDAEKQSEQVDTTKSEDYVGLSSNNYLKSLKVENATIEPKFNRQYVDYTVTLDDNTAKEINIIAETEDKNATVEGAGKVKLQEGTNTLRVVVTAENKSVQFYNLTVEVPVAQGTSTEEITEEEVGNNLETLMLQELMIAVLIAVLIIYGIIRAKNKQ